MESPIVYRAYIGITEKKMETTIVYWDYFMRFTSPYSCIYWVFTER